MEYQLVKVTQRGNSQGVYIPYKVRQKLGIRAGDYLKLTVQDNKIILEKVK